MDAPLHLQRCDIYSSQRVAPSAIGRPIAAQFIDDDTVALFEFVWTEEGVRALSERHYRLTLPDDLSDEEIEEYRRRLAS